jgi:hypothetical protein
MDEAAAEKLALGTTWKVSSLSDFAAVMLRAGQNRATLAVYYYGQTQEVHNGQLEYCESGPEYLVRFFVRMVQLLAYNRKAEDYQMTVAELSSMVCFDGELMLVEVPCWIVRAAETITGYRMDLTDRFDYIEPTVENALRVLAMRGETQRRIASAKISV